LQRKDVSTFAMIFQNMIRELENPGKAHRELLETYLRMLLIEALRKLDEAQPEPPPQDTANRLVGDFIALVDKNFRQIHAVSAYAEKLYVSPKSLSKRLHASGYKTPTEVIRNRIVLEAKRDLRYTQKSVKEIAFELGFDDPAYFTRFFKKAENQSPQAYRATFLEESK
ncbi:MAG: helix-turn-helix transcriptional regulator, partial [Bacteroidota bacterium]